MSKINSENIRLQPEMSLFLKLLLCACLMTLSHAKSVAEFKQMFMGLGLECSKDHPTSADEMLLMHQHKIPNSPNAKCLLACVYRKVNWIDDKGMFDIPSATVMIEKEHVDDESKQENSKKLFEICKAVNDEEVTDGEKGCDRAALLAKCLIKNAPKTGFELIV